MATMLGLRQRNERYTCKISHSPSVICDRCRVVSRKAIEPDPWMLDDERLVLAHIRGLLHDRELCPSCVAERAMSTLRRVQAAWDEGF